MNTDLQNEEWQKWEKNHKRGKIIGGLIITAAGLLFLARELGADLPYWLFSWKILLMVIGIAMAVRHKMRHPGWILFFVGGAFLINDLYPELHFKPFLWPVLLIMLGLFIIFKPRRKCTGMHRHGRYGGRGRHGRWHYEYKDQFEPRGGQHEPGSHETVDGAAKFNEDYLESTAIMAGIKKNIMTKNFKGGDVTIVLGGAELNFMQADFEDKAQLELTQVIGGTKLIVPANWEIRSELVAILGGMEDKRQLQPTLTGEKPKVLLLTGTIVLGGIEIMSY